MAADIRLSVVFQEDIWRWRSTTGSSAPIVTVSSTWTRKTSTRAIPSAATSAAPFLTVLSTDPLELESAEEVEEEEEEDDDFVEEDEEEAEEDWH